MAPSLQHHGQMCRRSAAPGAAGSAKLRARLPLHRGFNHCPAVRVPRGGTAAALAQLEPHGRSLVSLQRG